MYGYVCIRVWVCSMCVSGWYVHAKETLVCVWETVRGSGSSSGGCTYLLCLMASPSLPSFLFLLFCFSLSLSTYPHAS